MFCITRYQFIMIPASSGVLVINKLIKYICTFVFMFDNITGGKANESCWSAGSIQNAAIFSPFNFQRDVISRCVSELEINAGLQEIEYFSLSNHFCIWVHSKPAR